MSAAMGAVAGGLALVVLDAMVQSQSSSGEISAAGKAAAGLVNRFVSPAVPAIPDLRGTTSGSGASTSSGSTSTGSTSSTSTTTPTPTAIGGGRYIT